MEFYSNTKPELLGEKMKDVVYKLVNDAPKKTTISDKISKGTVIFYEAYIYPHKWIYLMLLIIIVFLIYRYYNKKNRENFSSSIINDITSTQTANLRYDTQPTMNPLYPVSLQQEKVYYPPDPLPINIPGEGIVYARDIYDEPKPYPPLNAPVDYDYNNVYKYPSRSYYTGTYNTYDKPAESDIINPLGFNSRFNATTADFIGKMTNDNARVMLTYQQILDNTEGNLINALKMGPKGLTPQKPDYAMQPPYSVE